MRFIPWNNTDPNAAAYIAAVTAAKGSAPSATQSAAINDFYVASKGDGYYTSLKRLYLPIWANAAANAIDLIGLGSGTFVGGITHAAGYAQGNGTTGYFDYGTTANAQGLSASTGSLFWLSYLAGTTGIQIGALESVTIRSSLFSTSSEIATLELTTTATAVNPVLSAVGLNLGILIGTRISTTSNKMFHRRSTFDQRGATNTTLETVAAPIINQMAWARKRSSGQDSYSNAGLGAHGLGLGLSDSASSSFTLALKTLWETATGLTRP